MEIAQQALAQSFAHQTVLAVLVITHPNPAGFADLLEQMWAQGQIEQAQHGLASADARAAARALYEELRDIARMEADRRAASL